MGVIAVFAYVAVVWLALGLLTIGLLNLAKRAVRSTGRATDLVPPIDATWPNRPPALLRAPLPAPTLAMSRERTPAALA